MSVSDFLFQGSAPASFTSINTTDTDMPGWYQTARQALISRASSIAGEPYQAYTGPRIASLTPDQTNAFSKVRETVDQGNPLFGQSQSLLDKNAAGFNETDFNKFMNPYTGQMMDELGRQANRNLTENLLPAVNDTFTGSGMFGSTRHADFSNRALRDTQESLIGAQGNLLGSSYNNAMDSYTADRALNNETANRYGALGQMMYNQGISGASALDTIGRTQQDQNQRGLDLAYNDFTTQRDAPKQNLELMSGVINAYQPQGSQFQSNTSQLPSGQTTPSPLAQLFAQQSQNQYF